MMEFWLKIWELLLIKEAGKLVWIIGILLALTIIEHLFPAEEGQTLGGRARNLVYMFLYRAFGLPILALIYMTYRPQGLIAYQPSAYELVLSVFANLLVIDFLFYWYHRAQHKFRALWAIHELHHADGELNATTSYRTYWLEVPAQYLIIVVPTTLLFGQMGPSHAYATYILSTFFLIFGHCNFRLSLGLLTPIFCGPQVHRIHHSILPEHRDRNFAQFFPFIDILFGTYRRPEKNEYPPTGAEGLPSNASFFRSMTQPFLIWFEDFKGLVGRIVGTAAK